MIWTIHSRYRKWLRIGFFSSFFFKQRKLCTYDSSVVHTIKFGCKKEWKIRVNETKTLMTNRLCNAIVLIWKPLDDNKYLFIHTKFVVCVFLSCFWFISSILLYNIQKIHRCRCRRRLLFSVFLRRWFFHFKQQNQVSKANSLMNKQTLEKRISLVVAVI